MFYEFLLNYVDTITFLNVFKYITSRTGLAVFTSLIIVLLIGGPFINFFSNRKILNPIRDDGPSDHIIKKIGTPTMGGVIILIVFCLCFMWGDLKISIFYFVYILFYLWFTWSFWWFQKIKNGNSSGISSRFKLIAQVILAVWNVFFNLVYRIWRIKKFIFSIFKKFMINLGWFFIPFQFLS